MWTALAALVAARWCRLRLSRSVPALGLASAGVHTLAREGHKLAGLVGEKRERVRDRSRAMGRRALPRRRPTVRPISRSRRQAARDRSRTRCAPSLTISPTRAHWRASMRVASWASAASDGQRTSASTTVARRASRGARGAKRFSRTALSMSSSVISSMTSAPNRRASFRIVDSCGTDAVTDSPTKRRKMQRVRHLPDQRLIAPAGSTCSSARRSTADLPESLTSQADSGRQTGQFPGQIASIMPPLMTISSSHAPAPVIWISGFSASGKTTVGRFVEAELRRDGTPVVFLDGDDLRAIFAGRWGYTTEDRIELARVYFRLCSHLSSQGVTVVICAIAMYDDVRLWLKDNVPAALEIHLDVPEHERLKRDSATKKVYARIDGTAPAYDLPRAPDLTVHNYGEVSAQQAADQIVRFVSDHRRARRVDHGRTDHWDRFYQGAVAPSDASSFAVAVTESFPGPLNILEVGCGNGRDAVYFAARGHAVVAIDRSETAIQAGHAATSAPGLDFRVAEVTDLEGLDGHFDVVYSRFCLHAMTIPEENEFIEYSRRLLTSGGVLLVECRSINDPLAREGEVISKTERIHGHYRRFIVADELRSKLEQAAFSVEQLVEARGVARLGDDDPVVIRLKAVSR